MGKSSRWALVAFIFIDIILGISAFLLHYDRGIYAHTKNYTDFIYAISKINSGLPRFEFINHRNSCAFKNIGFLSWLIGLSSFPIFLVQFPKGIRDFYKKDKPWNKEVKSKFLETRGKTKIVLGFSYTSYI